MKRNVGILIFEDAEVLDFCGPFEVFAITSELNDYGLFNVFTVAKTVNPVTAVNGLSVNPDYSFKIAPAIDILIISGGSGSRIQMNDADTLNWVKEVHRQTEYTVSICSGSRILGALGLLDNQPFCTHHEVYEHMQEIAPRAIPQRHKRFTNFGNVYTSGGISAGIDVSFHLVEKIHGPEIAQKTADYMEYTREVVHTA